MLFPVSILTVRAYWVFRKLLLENRLLLHIQVFDEGFSGILTKFASLSADRRPKPEGDVFCAGGKRDAVDPALFRASANCAFTMISRIDAGILSKVRAKAPLNLKKSRWALGIVMGDNKRLVHLTPRPGEESGLTGKDVRPFVLKQPSKFTLFDRRRLQQAAKDEIYRATEKLVYKFISKRLAFALDMTGTLCLNSANILISKVEGMCVKFVMAYQNSILCQYLYIQLFDELKVLKGNLLSLPCPALSPVQDKEPAQLAALAMEEADGAAAAIDD